MRYLNVCLVVLWTFAYAPQAIAVMPQAGDLILLDLGNDQILLQDADTGEISVVSSWNISNGNPLIGTGPEPIFGDDAQMGPDGYLYMGVGQMIRVNLETGDREEVVAPGTAAGPYVVYPAPSFFPASVASLGGWAAAVLLAGIFIGVQMNILGPIKA